MKNAKYLPWILFLALLVPFQAIQANDITYGALVDALKPDNQTKAGLKQVWKQYQGKTVTWSGILVEAKERKHYTVLRVLDKSRKDYQGFNITVEAKDKDRAASFKKGQVIRFTGELDKFDHKSNGATLIVIEHASLL